MTPKVKEEALSAIWAIVQPLLPTAKNGCRQALIGKHLEHPERNLEWASTIPVPFGGSPGWVSVWQDGGGGITVILWSPDHKVIGVREEIHDIQRRLNSIRVPVQVRWIRPEGWLAQRGWKIADGCKC